MHTKQTRTEKSADKILQMILEGKYQPGQSLPQRKVAEMLDVSPIVAREAFRILERAGVVEITANSGSRIATFSLKKLKGQYLVREVLEGLAARMAAKNIQKEQADKLCSLANQLDRFFNDPDADYHQCTLVHYKFHASIIFLSGCPEIMLSLKQINLQHLIFFTNRIANLKKIIQPSASWHRELADVIASQNPDQAEKLMKIHVRIGLQQIVESMQKDEAKQSLSLSSISKIDSRFNFDDTFSAEYLMQEKEVM